MTRRIPVLLLVMTALAVRGATNYVAHGGAHIAPFASWAAASTNIAAALAAAADGNVIAISNGLYAGIIAMTNRTLTVAGQGSGKTIVRHAIGQPVALVLDGSTAQFHSLTFSNTNGRGVQCQDSSLLLAQCSIFEGQIDEGAGVLISNSVFTITQAYFRRNAGIFAGGAGVIIDSTGSVEDSIIANNLTYDFLNPIGGFWITNSQVTFYHCVVRDNIGAGIDAVNARVHIRNSIVWNNACAITAEFSCVQDGVPGPGVITDDPLMTVTSHLQWNSPCINSGTNTPGAPVDMDGESRPQGPARDMGVDEWLSTTGDRVPDWWKAVWGFDLDSATVWQQDPNSDGILNIDHYAQNTTPVNTNILRIIGASNTVVRALKTLTNTVEVIAGTNVLQGITCLTNNAPGSSFSVSGTTGVFVWTPSLAQIGVWPNVSFIAWDAVAAVTNHTTVTVLQTNRAPVLAPIGNKTVGEGQSLSFLVTAADPDSDMLTLVCSNQALPGSLFTPVANGTSSFSWTPGYDAAGVYPGIFFGAYDGAFWSAESISITVTNVPNPPANVALTINNGARYTNASPVMVSLPASNTAWMAIAASAAALTNWMPYTPVTNWPLSSLHGTNTLWARFRSPWLDESTNVSNWIIADTNPPACTPLFPPNGYIATSQVTLAWSAADMAGGSGIASYRLQTNNAIVTLSTNVFVAGVTYQTNWWRVLAYDAAGNTSAWTELRWYVIPEPALPALLGLYLLLRSMRAARAT